MWSLFQGHTIVIVLFPQAHGKCLPVGSLIDTPNLKKTFRIKIKKKRTRNRLGMQTTFKEFALTKSN